MTRIKRALIVIFALALLLVLTGCQESNESKYSRAQKLLSEKKYEDAIKIFDEISTYEDSSKMSMYAKAILAGENGDYETAYSGFSALGDYKDCQMMIAYYAARRYENAGSISYWTPWLIAAEAYDANKLFLDSSERAENCRKQVYDGAVIQAKDGKYTESIQMLTDLGKYSDSENLKKYYTAFSLEQEGKIFEASVAFKELGFYKDSVDQAEAVLKRYYDKAVALDEAGDRDSAAAMFIYLGDYSDSYERAYKPYYDSGIALRNESKWDQAVEQFRKAGTYNDALDQIDETLYLKAEALEKAGKTDEACSVFRSLGNYKDSYTRAHKPYYDKGAELLNQGNWDEAYSMFSLADNYSDAKEKMNEVTYQKADECEKNGDQEGAYSLFKSLGDYSDSFERAYKPYYDLGIKLQKEEDWENAEAAFVKAEQYADAQIQINETKYLHAKALIASEDYKGAVAILSDIVGYKDVKSLLENDENLAAVVEHNKKLKKLQTIGSIVAIGSYPQTANGTDQTPVEWLVLDYNEESNSSLLLCRKGIDVKPFDAIEMSGATWEKCSLRRWLNNDFINKAFNLEEQSAILDTAVDNSSNQGYSGWKTSGGNDTIDKIFLLSYAEAKKYLKLDKNNHNNSTARATPTAYALNAGAYTNGGKSDDGGEAGWWWLRSPGEFSGGAIYVAGTGSFDDLNKSYDFVCVRPALWLDLNSY